MSKGILGLLALEGGTDMVSRNVRNQLNLAA
jgi:hypothetical protein